MYIPDWKEYELLDAGGGEKLERWGDVILLRPEPQAIWPMKSKDIKPHAYYKKGSGSDGGWVISQKMPQSWEIAYQDLCFIIKPASFKHTGLFPEQAHNWDFMRRALKSRKNASVLNLFAYTGGASVACLKAGAQVTHVDSSKGMVNWAKENIARNGLQEQPVRFIVDDVMKFVQREKRRNKTYDAVVMDPPSYGYGPSKERWKLEEGLYPLVAACAELLSERPLFFVINSYTAGLDAQVIGNILRLVVQQRCGGHVEAHSLGLRVRARNIVLPCGVTGRWSGDHS
ncbi:MAG: class I SAM-dependent methyltransferase [Christensenellales bacterium]|jgi:23S rRNA (cytosine1962-C5)-methyltransferase